MQDQQVLRVGHGEEGENYFIGQSLQIGVTDLIEEQKPAEQHRLTQFIEPRHIHRWDFARRVVAPVAARHYAEHSFPYEENVLGERGRGYANFLRTPR